MFTTAPHDLTLGVEDDARRIRSLLYDDRVGHRLLAGEPVPTDEQVALTLRALADFPLCMRILPLAGYRRLGDEVTGVSRYLAGFAAYLARSDERMTYDPRYWILGAPVTTRLMRALAATARTTPAHLPSVRQCATVLLALADTGAGELPRRIVQIAGDGDLPWNGATGIGRWFGRLADTIAPDGAAPASALNGPHAVTPRESTPLWDHKSL